MRGLCARYIKLSYGKKRKQVKDAVGAKSRQVLRTPSIQYSYLALRRRGHGGEVLSLPIVGDVCAPRARGLLLQWKTAIGTLGG